MGANSTVGSADPMRPGARVPFGRTVAAHGAGALALIVLALILNLPGLGQRELDKEEGRRLLATQALLEGEAKVLPSIWGRPYLTKPPFFYWSVGAVARVAERAGLEPTGRNAAAGEPGWVPASRRPVTPLAGRWTALLAAILTALAIQLSSARARPWAGWVGGALFLVAPNLLGKSTLAEIETTFALWSAAAAFLTVEAVLARRRAGRFVAQIAAGLCLGAALLSKGPFGAAPVLGGLLAGFVFDRERRWRFASVGGVVLALGAVAIRTWTWLALEADAGYRATFIAEMTRGGFEGLGEYVRDRLGLMMGLLGGWAPAAPILGVGLACSAAVRRALWTDPRLRFSLGALALGIAVLSVCPGVRTRYAMPLLPCACLLTGRLLAAGFAPEGARGLVEFGRRAGRVGVGILGALTMTVGALFIARVLGASGGLFEGLATDKGLAGWGLAALGVGGLALERARRAGPERAGLVLGIGLFALVLLRSIERTTIAPGLDQADHRMQSAALVEARSAAPTWWVDRFAEFNTLYYLRRELVYRSPESADGVPAGGHLLTGYEDHPELWGDPGWTCLWAWDGVDLRVPWPARNLELWRRGAGLGPAAR